MDFNKLLGKSIIHVTYILIAKTIASVKAYAANCATSVASLFRVNTFAPIAA